MLNLREKDVMKNKFNQINKEIILNYVVKNTSLRKKMYTH